MKSFDDFVSTLSAQKVTELVGKANQAATSIANSVPEQQKETLIAVTAFTTSLELLREYHEWLNQ
ncbi:hypothetical protein [Streptococcus suis]|uniref:hypothetical protein n=1 Tax=Streptococcus suis TaxID=1307 RepID=UPI001C9438FB|nr:hypothetical protein [Streptococcus suis]MBY5009442.1 hypothetical protein [Streptococcus suis]MDG4519515.1 hypothetical protein [Streptococcus suis]